MNISFPYYKLSISYFQRLCKDIYTWRSSTLFSFELALSLHIMSSHFLSATYWASLWGVLSGFVLFDGSQWCCTQHPSADILISFPISCWKTPSHCWWDKTLRRSIVLKEDIQHGIPWKTFYCELLSKIWLWNDLLSSTVKQCREGPPQLPWQMFG